MIHHFSEIGVPFITLSEVDSTNNYAMARLGEGPVTEGTTWFAWNQTSGKGQRGHKWESTQGENVIMSVVLKPLMLRPSDQFMLSATIALALKDLVASYVPDPPQIKWSNDIYLGDKKAGGILIENIIRGNTWTYAVVGIGLNINQENFPPDLPNPVSLRQISGHSYEVLEVAAQLCRCIDQRYARLFPENFDPILAEYTRSLYRLGQVQPFRRDHTTFQATIRGVEKDGRLVLEKDRVLLKLNFGEVSFVTP